jgi:ergothioneine biosynthesis protein EgtB
MQRDELKLSYQRVRKITERICNPLELEDYVVQPIEDVSPPKWHLAHTSWFFETFILEPFATGYTPFHPKYGFLFNSYYHTFGERWDRPRRGVLSRPTVKQVYEYREFTDQLMLKLFDSLSQKEWERFWPLVVLGLHHEQQHQELLLMDIKVIMASNPLLPTYKKQDDAKAASPVPAFNDVEIEGGVYEIGHRGTEFSFDNESPVHKVFVDDFAVQNRLVTNGEYLEFMQDGGYEASELWLADGWGARNQHHWRSPEHWLQLDGEWIEMTLHGPQPVNPHIPVSHVSFYEAEAFASWKGRRLLTEQEWEIAARHYANAPEGGNFMDDQIYHPVSPGEQKDANILYQMLGDVWEWTSSAYLPYPGYVQQEGALGEYNGKFMINQMVLRGGCCATPRDHIRLTYRNFFQPEKRWPFTGIRLAKK